MKAWQRWVTLAGVAVILALFGLLMAGCMEDGQDGAAGAPGPAGADGEDGESYVSYTNAATGQITTVAVQAGDNSPVEIVINQSDGTGTEAGTRENPPAPEGGVTP